MIGQAYNRSFIKGLIDKDYFPRFVLIVGDKGSGKKTLADYIAVNMNCNSYIVPDVKIATIREVINNSYYQKTKMLYIIPDIDDMSKEAQNSILKITEEPPNKAYFVMTVDDLNNVLPTIKSRAYQIWMDKYSAKEITEYAVGKVTTSMSDICNICETPGEVDEFIRCGEVKFIQFVDKVVDNVDSVSTANSLKLLENLDLKNTGTGYDVQLFLKIFIRQCMSRAATIFDYKESLHYIQMVIPSSEALKKLNVRGANKNMIMTNWIFDIRSGNGSN